jgi:hypothetical protein
MEEIVFKDEWNRIRLCLMAEFDTSDAEHLGCATNVPDRNVLTYFLNKEITSKFIYTKHSF